MERRGSRTEVGLSEGTPETMQIGVGGWPVAVAIAAVSGTGWEPLHPTLAWIPQALGLHRGLGNHGTPLSVQSRAAIPGSCQGPHTSAGAWGTTGGCAEAEVPVGYYRLGGRGE